MYNIISIAAIVSYFVPLAIVLIKGLQREPFFLLFAGYWAIGGVINSIDLFPEFPSEVSYTIGVIYNMLDIPIILGIFYYTTSSILMRRFILLALAFTIVIEITSTAIMGLDYDALKYSLGTGIALVIAVVIWEIVRYLQKIEHSNRQNAKIFIYAALLFEYGTFILIYIFDYFIANSSRKDSFLIYYISTLVAILIASCGYLLFRKYENKPVVIMD